MTVLTTAARRAGAMLTALAAGAALLTAGCGVRHAYYAPSVYAPAPPVVVVHHYGSGYGGSYGRCPVVVHHYH